MAAAASIAVGALLFAACGGSDDGPVDSEPDYSGWPLALVPASPGGDGALVEGTLVLRDGCLFIETDHAEPPNLYLPIFEYPGTEWNADSEELTIGDETYAVGDPVRFGGGGLSRELEGVLADFPFLKPPPETCEIEAIWFVDSV